MTWREKVVAHILLLLARMLTEDPAIADELKKLSAHISVNAPKEAA